jgi:hypothetical protein
MVVLYKQGALTSTGIRDLKKAGFSCVAVKGEFTDVQFRMAGGIGWEDDLGDMQIMVLKAAIGAIGFDGRIGALVVNALRKRLADAEQKRS